MSHDPIPFERPCATFFLDESGSKGSAGQFMVVGGIKTRSPGHLIRQAQAVLREHQFQGELKFSEITRRSVRMFEDLIDVMVDEDTHIKAFVVDKRTRNPFLDVPVWDAQSGLIAQLLIGGINKSELAVAVLDELSAPKGVSISDIVRDKVHQKFDSLALVSCMPADSRSSLGLQLADLVVGAVAHDRKTRGAPGGARAINPASPKARVVQALCSAYRVPDLADVRRGRVGILTSRPKNLRRSTLASE